MSRGVNVLQFCHQLNVQGKCHHGESDIEPKRTTKVKRTE
jgi:hypothetical protein